MSTVVTYFIAAHSLVTNCFFWNGLLSLLSGIEVFFIAMSAELEVKLKTGDAAIDERAAWCVNLLLVL